MEISDILFKRIKLEEIRNYFQKVMIVKIQLIVLQKFSQKYQGHLCKYQKFWYRNVKGWCYRKSPKNVKDNRTMIGLLL